MKLRYVVPILVILFILQGCGTETTAEQFTEIMCDSGYNISLIEDTAALSHYQATTNEYSFDCVTYNDQIDAHTAFLQMNEDCMNRVEFKDVVSYKFHIKSGDFVIETRDKYCALFMCNNVIIYAIDDISKKDKIVRVLSILGFTEIEEM